MPKPILKMHIMLLLITQMCTYTAVMLVLAFVMIRRKFTSYLSFCTGRKHRTSVLVQYASCLYARNLNILRQKAGKILYLTVEKLPIFLSRDITSIGWQ